MANSLLSLDLIDQLPSLVGYRKIKFYATEFTPSARFHTRWKNGVSDRLRQHGLMSVPHILMSQHRQLTSAIATPATIHAPNVTPIAIMQILLIHRVIHWLLSAATMTVAARLMP